MMNWWDPFDQSGGGGAGDRFSAQFSGWELDPYAGMPEQMRQAVVEHDRLVAQAAATSRAAAAVRQALAHGDTAQAAQILARHEAVGLSDGQTSRFGAEAARWVVGDAAAGALHEAPHASQAAAHLAAQLADGPAHTQPAAPTGQAQSLHLPPAPPPIQAGQIIPPASQLRLPITPASEPHIDLADEAPAWNEGRAELAAELVAARQGADQARQSRDRVWQAEAARADVQPAVVAGPASETGVAGRVWPAQLGISDWSLGCFYSIFVNCVIPKSFTLPTLSFTFPSSASILSPDALAPDSQWSVD